MKPHEVIKENIERFEEYAYYELPHGMDRVEGIVYRKEEFGNPLYYNAMQINMDAILLKNNISLLLSVKETIKEKEMTREKWIVEREYFGCCGEEVIGYNQALSDLQLLLDEEINKIKEFN